MISDLTVLIQAIVVCIFIVSAAILLIKLNAFADLHSSDRAGYRKKYLFLGICMTLIAFAALFSFSCTIPLVVPTYYEDPKSTVILTSFNLLCNVLATMGIVLILQPTDLDDSNRRPSSKKSGNSRSQKEKFSKEKADEPLRDGESISIGTIN